MFVYFLLYLYNEKENSKSLDKFGFLKKISYICINERKFYKIDIS